MRTPFITATMRPKTFATGLMIGAFLICTAGCDKPKPATPAGPTPREVALMKTVDDLQGKLAAAEQATAQAKAEAAQALEQLKSALAATQTKAEEASAPKVEIKITDTSYVVVKKSLTVGQLISKATPSNPGATERRPAEFRITFKGVQSGKEYPPLEVQETAYSWFREGLAYAPQDINRAKKTAPDTDGAAGTGSSPAQNTGGNNSISDAQLRTLFGSPAN